MDLEPLSGYPYANAYQCMQLRMDDQGIIPGLGSKNRLSIGIPTEQQYVETYCEFSNTPRIENWSFYIAFSFFRFASILQGVKKRTSSLSRFARLYVEQIMGCLLKSLVTLRNPGAPNCSVCSMGFPRTTPSVMYLQRLIAANLVIVFPSGCRTWSI